MLPISLNATDALEYLQKVNTVVLDIRDESSFAQGHLKGAVHFHNGNADQIIDALDPAQHVIIVCCFHGISSQGVVNNLRERGFENSFSLEGGFESWKLQHPFES